MEDFFPPSGPAGLNVLSRLEVRVNVLLSRSVANENAAASRTNKAEFETSALGNASTLPATRPPTVSITGERSLANTVSYSSNKPSA